MFLIYLVKNKKMKTLKKIIWFLVILAIIYIALIFIKPVIADSIAKNI